MTRTLERLAAALLGLLAIGFTAGLLARATLRVSRTFNEGWNAYHATAVFAGQPLYPPPGALVTTNYPPLSFLLTALLMHAVPDAVFAGRLLAVAAFLSVLLLVALIARGDGGSGQGGWPAGEWLGGGVAAAVFAVHMAVVAPNYVAMDDPQMLAHAIMLAGAWLLLRPRAGPATVVGAALLMAAGLFVKHNLVALPLAATLWLAWTGGQREGQGSAQGSAGRRRALLFAASLLLAGGLGLLASRLAFGPDFIRGLLAPRQTSLGKSWHDTLAALGGLQGLLVLAGLAVALGRRDRLRRFLGLYLAAALAVGALAAAGAEVGDNAFYELAIAAAIATGRLVALAGRPLRPRLRLAAIAAAAFAVLATPELATAKDMLLLPQWLAQQRTRAAETRAVVAAIAARPGPALCETAVFCYWAGKPFEVDAVNFRQGLAAGTMSAEGLIDRLARGDFATIVLDRSDTDAFPPDVMAALHARYVAVPVANPRQTVFVPD